MGFQNTYLNMLITQEQQEALVDEYVKEKHTTEECIGFIDGINAILELAVRISKNQISQTNKKPKYMQEVIITGYTAKSEGVILETNIPAKLKTANVKGTRIFVSWDKIGKLLFDGYTEKQEVSERDELRAKAN